jgi:diguanylate cyclase (GGDEF)-like protein
VYQYTGLIFGIGALLLIGLALYTAYEVRQVNALAEQTRELAARQDMEQAIRTLLADARAILREAALWDETREQLENSEYYQFWWRSRLMNPARVSHYVLAIELYDDAGRSLSEVSESPLPSRIARLDPYVSWDGYGNSLFHFIRILSVRGNLPAVGYLGVRLSLPLAMPELYQFNHLVGDSVVFDLPPDVKLPPEALLDHAEYDLPAHSELHTLVGSVNQGTIRLITLNMLVLVLGVLAIYGVVSRPLRLLERRVSELDSVSDPDTEPDIPRSRVRELDQLGMAIDHYHSALRRLTKDLDQKNAELWGLAHLDPLTGVRNRRAFEEDWEELIGRMELEPEPVTFLMFDCDQLKSINDNYGHATGDLVIQTVARLVTEQLSQEATLYRLGGDEFATVLVGHGIESAQSLAERCQAAVAAEPAAGMGTRETIRISTGLSHADGSDLPVLRTLPREADAAMYRSKRLNRTPPVVG